MANLERLLSREGVVAALQHLGASPDVVLQRSELESNLAAVPITQASDVVDILIANTLLASYGERLGLSTKGQRTALLLEALDGGDIDDVFRRLRRVSGHPEMYQLVREGMTTLFFRSLVERPGFQRLFICSPWINPSEKDGAMLRYALLSSMKSHGDSPEVLVISRPRDMMPEGTEKGLTIFEEVGAKIWFNRRLHSKLYIREPGARGGSPIAIVGSQNLTRSTNLELGIRINGDSRLIDQLIRYFLEIMSRSVDLNSSQE